MELTPAEKRFLLKAYEEKVVSDSTLLAAAVANAVGNVLRKKGKKPKKLWQKCPRHADQQVRGAVVLPNGTGKKVRVCVFCKENKYEAAQAAGADYVGGQDLVDKITKENWMDFDVVIASPDMMGLVGRLGKVLGPRGLMPNPKAGTVTPDVAKAVTEAKAGKIEYRLDKTNIIHCPIGKASFGADKLTQNFETLMEAIVKAKPAAAKGTYLKSCVVTSTMGVGVRVATSKYGV